MYNKKERSILLNNLGNLVLLGQSKNSEFQNKCFSFKKKHTNNLNSEVGFYNGAYSEIEVSSFDNWTPKEIEIRGKKMLSFLEKRWNIKFSDWENVNKENILMLDFMKTEIATEK